MFTKNKISLGQLLRFERRFEGIWTDVSCIFDCTFVLISISENRILNVEHGDCSPLDQLLLYGKRLVIRDSEICQMA